MPIISSSSSSKFISSSKIKSPPNDYILDEALLSAESGHVETTSMRVGDYMNKLQQYLNHDDGDNNNNDDDSSDSLNFDLSKLAEQNISLYSHDNNNNNSNNGNNSDGGDYSGAYNIDDNN